MGLVPGSGRALLVAVGFLSLLSMVFRVTHYLSFIALLAIPFWRLS